MIIRELQLSMALYLAKLSFNCQLVFIMTIFQDQYAGWSSSKKEGLEAHRVHKHCGDLWIWRRPLFRPLWHSPSMKSPMECSNSMTRTAINSTKQWFRWMSSGRPAMKTSSGKLLSGSPRGWRIICRHKLAQVLARGCMAFTWLWSFVSRTLLQKMCGKHMTPYKT